MILYSKHFEDIFLMFFPIVIIGLLHVVYKKINKHSKKQTATCYGPY